MTETIGMTPMQIAARKHRAADMLRSGTYGEMNGEFHACSVGCFAYEVAPERFSDSAGWADDEPHRIVAEAYDYPEWLVWLQDRVSEGIPPEARLDWHVQIADAIAARKRDWQTILHAVHAAILRISYRTAGDAAGAVRAVIDLHERSAAGENIPIEDWSAAEVAAWIVAERAAERAAWSAMSAAESAAWSADWIENWSAAEISAESAAESAARIAARIAAESAAESAARGARSAAYIGIRDGILAELIRE